MLSRRNFLLASTGVAAVGTGLGSCAIFSPTGTSEWVPPLQAIAVEITQIIPELVKVGLGGNTLNSVQQIVGEIQQVLSAITSASNQGQGQSVLAQIENYINDLAPLILPFVSLIPGGTIIGLIVAALPAIEAMLNVIVTQLTALAQSLAGSAPPLPSASGRFGARFGVNSQAYVTLLVNRAAQRSARFRHSLHH